MEQAYIRCNCDLNPRDEVRLKWQTSAILLMLMTDIFMSFSMHHWFKWLVGKLYNECPHHPHTGVVFCKLSTDHIKCLLFSWRGCLRWCYVWESFEMITSLEILTFVLFFISFSARRWGEGAVEGSSSLRILVISSCFDTNCWYIDKTLNWWSILEFLFFYFILAVVWHGAMPQPLPTSPPPRVRYREDPHRFVNNVACKLFVHKLHRLMEMVHSI